jgi:hypothetical protein
MAGKSTTYEARTLEYNLGLSAPASPSGTYLALFTVAPTDSSAGTGEVSGGGYARQAITWGATSGGSPTSVSNSATITFPTATASWGTIVAFAVFDAATAGNIIYWGTLTSVTVNASNQVVVNAGSLTITED